MDRESLDAFAVLHGTDKSSKVHSYTRLYERYFAPWRDNPICLLEIGIGSGASLRMWRDYFPHARICGLDVGDCRSLEKHCITIFQGNQGERETLATVAARAGPFDVVVDDGSHLWSHQISTFLTLYPHVCPGGYYVIEDLHTSYWETYREGSETTMGFLKGLADEINLSGKSGYGDPRNDPSYPRLRDELSFLQNTLDSITFSKSIAFVQKRLTTGVRP